MNDDWLRTGPCVLAVDPGGKRVGLAFAGREGLVRPLDVWRYSGVDVCARRLVEEMERLGAEVCVMGLPTGADGRETPACRRSRALGKALANLGVRVHYQEEYLSSHAARERAQGIGRKPGRPIDDLAAAIILEDYLECRKRKKQD